MKQKRLSNILMLLAINFIISILTSCKTDYNKQIIGLWKLDKIENIDLGEKEQPEFDTMYFEFETNNSLVYNTSVGVRDSFQYTMENDHLTTSYLKSNTLDSLAFDNLSYKIVRLNKNELILEFKKPSYEGANDSILMRYYCINVPMSTKQLLYKKNKEFDKQIVMQQFNDFKKGFKGQTGNLYNGYQIPDSIYDEYLWCLYNNLYGEESPLSKDEKIMVGRKGLTDEINNKLKPYDAACEEIIKSSLIKKK